MPRSSKLMVFIFCFMDSITERALMVDDVLENKSFVIPTVFTCFSPACTLVNSHGSYRGQKLWRLKSTHICRQDIKLGKIGVGGAGVTLVIVVWSWKALHGLQIVCQELKILMDPSLSLDKECYLVSIFLFHQLECQECSCFDDGNKNVIIKLAYY